MEKKCKVVLLPTDKSRISLYKDGLLSFAQEVHFGIPNEMIPQHLYILSDDEIKVNDYISDGYKVWQWRDDSSLLGRKKVIATTNPDLNIAVMEDNEENAGFGGYYILDNGKVGSPKYISKEERNSILKSNVASIDDDFIKVYCNNPVEEVLVKYNQHYNKHTKENYYTLELPNGSIIIKPVEETWDQILIEYSNYRDNIKLELNNIEQWRQKLKPISIFLKENYNVPTKK